MYGSLWSVKGNSGIEFCANKLTYLEQKVGNYLSRESEASQIVCNPRKQVERYLNNSLVTANLKKRFYVILME